jgi:hypothetical protein
MPAPLPTSSPGHDERALRYPGAVEVTNVALLLQLLQRLPCRALLYIAPPESTTYSFKYVQFPPSARSNLLSIQSKCKKFPPQHLNHAHFHHHGTTPSLSVNVPDSASFPAVANCTILVAPTAAVAPAFICAVIFVATSPGQTALTFPPSGSRMRW